MAKRKRLTPAQPGYLPVSATVPQAHPGLATALGGGNRPPIAQVAGDAAAAAALDEVSGELRRARDEGRMVLSLPLASVNAHHLVRDRTGVDGDALTELKESLRARGQQTPVEVVDLGPDLEADQTTGRYGLISGWRRMLALEELFQDTGEDRFAEVLALVRRPAGSADAYVAMVEENEIRADLSFYERARIVLCAVEEGVFETEKKALQSLFSTAAFAKRSKIKSFLPVVRALDDALTFPAAISERLGLALSKALTADAGLADRIAAVLDREEPDTAAAEMAVLTQALADEKLQNKESERQVSNEKTSAETLAEPPMSDPFLIAPGIRISQRRGRVVLEGDGVNPGFIDRLMDWTRSQR